MKNQITGLMAIALFLFTIAACSKEEVLDAPELTITSPAANGMFSPGDTIRITGTATASAADDAHLLHDVMLAVKRTSDSSALFSAHYSIHMMEQFAFDTFFVAPAVATATDAFVEAKAENHIPMVATKSVAIMIHP